MRMRTSRGSGQSADVGSIMGFTIGNSTLRKVTRYLIHSLWDFQNEALHTVRDGILLQKADQTCSKLSK